MPTVTGNATQNRNVRKPGQAQMTMKIISIAYRIIPIITAESKLLSLYVGSVVKRLTDPSKDTDDSNKN